MTGTWQVWILSVAMSMALGLGFAAAQGQALPAGERAAFSRDARQEARQRLDEMIADRTAASEPMVNQTSSNQTSANPTSATVGLRAADIGLWFGGGEVASGLTVADLADQGLFSEAGLREGDRIVSLNGQPIRSEAQFMELITSPSLANQTPRITVARGGQQQSFTIHTGGLMQSVAASDPLFTSGLLMDERNPNQLVVQRVFPRTPAFYAGLRAGDVLTNINGQPIAGMESLVQALQSGNENLGLMVTRNGQPRRLNLGFGDGSIRTASRTAMGASSAATGAGATPLNGVPNAINTIPPAVAPSALNNAPQSGTIGPLPGTIPMQGAPGALGNAPQPGTIRPLPGTAPNQGAPGALGNANAAAIISGRAGVTPGVPLAPGITDPTVRSNINPPGGAGTFGGTGATAGGAGKVGGTGGAIGGTGSTAGGAGASGGTGGAAAGTGAGGGTGGAGGGGAGAGGT